MPTRRSIAHVRREKLRGDDAIVWRMWFCTSKEIAAFTGLSRKRVERIRERLGVRKYHRWTGKEFALVEAVRRKGYPATSALPSIGVSPKSLYNAIERNQHLAA